MNNQKPWKSFDEQLSLLEGRGLIIDNKTAARNYLERIGYYRLSGYWYPFRKVDQERSQKRLNLFLDHSHFEDAVRLYVFDKKLRLLAFDALERIELAVRVDISYLLGKKDVCAQYNPDLFHGKFSKHISPKSKRTAHQAWLDNLERQVKRARKEPFVIHYQRKYKNQLPIWVACELWDFGMLSHLFSGLKIEDQEIIAEKYGVIAARKVDGRRILLAQWLRSLNFIRNVAAHHSRLWNVNIVERSSSINTDLYWKELDNSKVFYYFCIMQQMIKAISPNSSWGQRFLNLLDNFPLPKNRAVDLCDMGIQNITTLKEWKLWELI